MSSDERVRINGTRRKNLAKIEKFVIDELQRRKGVVIITDHFVCEECKMLFHRSEKVIHHTDFKTRGKGRGREWRVRDWLKCFKEDAGSLAVLCDSCHRRIHSNYIKGSE